MALRLKPLTLLLFLMLDLTQQQIVCDLCDELREPSNPTCMSTHTRFAGNPVNRTVTAVRSNVYYSPDPESLFDQKDQIV